MYSSRDSTYAQKNYAAQSSYGQTPTSAYPGSSSSGADGGSQLTVASRHSSMLAGSHERDISAYRALPTSATHYTGQYSSLYNSSSLSSGQQVSTLSTNSAAPSALEARLAARHELSKFGASDYMSSSGLGYGLKTDRLAPGQYGERQSTYAGRDSQPEPAARFSDSVGYAHAHQHQSEIYDRIDQAVLREQMLKSQSLQSASHDGVARNPDYITARSATLRHPTQELGSYGSRVESGPHAISIASRPSYGGQPSPSVLGSAPQRTVEDIMHAQVSSTPGYGVSLPPGRDYGAGKGLHRSSLEPDDRKDERGGYVRDLDSREEDRQRERLREREKERERERERGREKDRKREREKDRERKHMLELRERDRGRDRERDRERERERKRALDARRERSPPRVSRDRHSSLTKDSRLIRRDSPHQEALHRLHSPVKDKRREYVCKVYSSRLVDVERDYMSIDKRYPRLYICPEFSKLVVRWPKESLKLPFRTPVSFEHDFVEEDTGAGKKKPSAELMEHKSVDSVNKGTVWNAKIILMSGLGRSVIEELSSDRISGDRIPHICSLLRFAVLKKGRSFIAIGGQWDPIDGGNPSNDDDSLVRTALRYVKDVAQLDLQNCKHWNRFLEIHYDRVGNDGLFSHKEVTVLFVPDLSHCLPSLNAWREQWLAHKKAVDEREKLLTSKKEKDREKKESIKEREINSAKETKRSETSDKKKEVVGTNLVPDTTKQKEVDGLSVVGVGDQGGESSRKAPVRKDGSELADKGKDITRKDVDGITPQDRTKPGKKKIVRRIVKKVARKKAGPASESKVNAMRSEKAPEDKDVEPESTADPADVKTFTRRKVTKTGSVGTAGASVLKEDKTVESSVKVESKQVPSAAKSLVKSDPSKAASPVGGPAKKTVKRKIIKRVIKKKNTIGASTNDTKEVKDCDNDEHVKIQDSGNAMVASKVEGQVDNSKKKADGIKSGNDLITGSQPGKAECKADKVVQKEDDKSVSGAKLAVETDKRSPMKNPETNTKSKEKENLSDGKEKKDKTGEDEPKTRSSKDAEKKSEEPPRPGFILQTRCGKDARLRSMSLSLDSLLDYSDKDVEESTFELSLFAESLYEMLQYQMGSRILTFLQKLRIKFVTERNQRKRHREETAGKQMDKQKSSKRLKTEQLNGETSSKSEATVKSEVKDEAHPDEERTEPKEEKMVVDENNKVKMEAKDVEGQQAEEDEEYEEEEDPEEASQEDEEMEDTSPEADSSNKLNNSERMTDTATEPEELGKDAKDSSAEQKSLEKVAKEMEPKDANKATERKDAGAATKPPQNFTVNRELVQAFRFFDRNRTGYIRLEDMRLIIHNLGKCLSHRDVKELAQSALLESNTGRDDHILYEKLVNMSFTDKE